jgi:hypothetical protein
MSSERICWAEAAPAVARSAAASIKAVAVKINLLGGRTSHLGE